MHETINNHIQGCLIASLYRCEDFRAAISLQASKFAETSPPNSTLTLTLYIYRNYTPTKAASQPQDYSLLIGDTEYRFQPSFVASSVDYPKMILGALSSLLSPIQLNPQLISHPFLTPHQRTLISTIQPNHLPIPPTAPIISEAFL